MIIQVVIITISILVVIGGGAGLYFALAGMQGKKQRDRRLAIIRGSGQAESAGRGHDEKTAQDKRRAEIARKLKETSATEKSQKKNDLRMKLVQAGMKISVKQFWINSVLFSIVVTVLMLLSGQNILVVLLVGFASFAGAPRLLLRWKAKRRQKKFLEDFADALEAMVRLLKAGMPVGEAIAMASREFTGPIGDEMSRIYDDQKIGVPLPEAVLESARRMPITEMQMFATGIAIQTQTGSSLSEVLTNLARVIRARFRLKRKIQALSSEAKTSAGIIGSLPFFIAGGLYLIDRDYVSVFYTTMTGQIWIVACGMWMLLGCLVMRAMINFKI